MKNASQYTSGGRYIDLGELTPDPVAATHSRPLLPWQEAEVRARRLAQARSVLDRLDRAATLDDLLRARRVIREAEGDG